MQVFTGDIELKSGEEIMLILHNCSKKEVKLSSQDTIATLHFPWKLYYNIPTSTFSTTTTQPSTSSTLTNCRAAKMEMNLQVCMDLPFDIDMSSDPYKKSHSLHNCH